MGPLSKPSKSEFWEGDTEHRSGAYLDVREHSSTGSTYPKTDFEGFERGPLCQRVLSLSCGSKFYKARKNSWRIRLITRYIKRLKGA
ncbi:MAG: palindromic element RPE1 domain-containing protein [Holosporales bacterium]|nr:palindromic element RPE1 domain-containing protein [Holosporales bacterium]